MASHPEGDVPARQVNNILQNLRGEHFRHARNVQGKPASSSSLSSHAHNQPTLPINLIYPSPAPAASPSHVPGPSPPRSWRSPTPSVPSSTSLSIGVKSDAGVVTDTPAWRKHALSPLFSADVAPSQPERARPRLIYPDPGPIPQLTLLCLQLIRVACPGTDLAHVVPFIPLHLRRALVRYTAIHAPLSQIELDALCEGTTHIDTELIVIGPHNTLRLRGSAFRARRNKSTTDAARRYDDDDLPTERVHDSEPGESESWDAVHTHDTEPPALRSLAVVSSPLSAPVVLAFPPTLTHLALIHIPHRIPVHRLPTVCPLLEFLDLSYNACLGASETGVGGDGRLVLEEVGWGKLRKLEVLGLRGCLVTPTLLLELNRGRWEDVRVIQ